VRKYDKFGLQNIKKHHNDYDDAAGANDELQYSGDQSFLQPKRGI
jgi:hypothetical protein